MAKYIVKDWAGNVMNWGEFSDTDYAYEAIHNHVLAEMGSDGHNTRWTEDREDGTEFDEELFDSYCEEYEIHEEHNMYTLQNIKDMYYTELATDCIERRPLEQYVREEFVPVYDEQLDFLGWERK